MHRCYFYICVGPPVYLSLIRVLHSCPWSTYLPVPCDCVFFFQVRLSSSPQVYMSPSSSASQSALFACPRVHPVSLSICLPVALSSYTVPQSALFTCPRVHPVSLSICLPVALSSYTVPQSALFACPRVSPVSLCICLPLVVSSYTVP
jgi:hypothetical protein